MLFRYDFGEKLDITKFNVQARHYIGQIRQIEYHLVLSHYKLVVNIDTPDGITSHLVTVKLSSLNRDKDNEIESEQTIYPLADARFQDLKIFQEIWADRYRLVGGWASNSSATTVDKIIVLLKIVHKINNLRAFI